MCSAEREIPPSVLARAVSLLDAFEPTRPTMTLAQLTRTSGLARSTAHRMCGELVGLGLLDQTPDGYRLGTHLQALGSAVPRGQDLREIARPFMEDLRIASGGRTVQLAVLDGVDVRFVEVLRGPATPRMPVHVGSRLPAHASAAGKAILAFSPPDVVAARVEAGLVRLTGRTITAPPSLARELGGVRASGVALDKEEAAVGLLCAAAPVIESGGRVAGALSLTGLTPPDIAAMAAAVRTAATSLSRTLGAFTP